MSWVDGNELQVGALYLVSVPSIESYLRNCGCVMMNIMQFVLHSIFSLPSQNPLLLALLPMWLGSAKVQQMSLKLEIH